MRSWAVLRPCLTPGLALAPARPGCNRTSVATGRGAKTLFAGEEMPAPIRQPPSSGTLDRVHPGKQRADTELPLALCRAGLGATGFELEGCLAHREEAQGTFPAALPWLTAGPRRGSARGSSCGQTPSKEGYCVAPKKLQPSLAGTGQICGCPVQAL